MIMSFLKLDNSWPEHDEVPWCAAFVNYVAWLMRLPRSKSLRARTWLSVGTPVEWDDTPIGFTVVILQRGGGNQPDASVIKAPGHVGFFAGFDLRNGSVLLLGGNQGDTVGVSPYPQERILGIRNLLPEV